MAWKFRDQFTIVDAPDLHRTIIARDAQESRVGSKRCGIDAAALPVEFPDQLAGCDCSQGDSSVFMTNYHETIIPA